MKTFRIEVKGDRMTLFINDTRIVSGSSDVLLPLVGEIVDAMKEEYKNRPVVVVGDR